jgi:hypothetical protein
MYAQQRSENLRSRCERSNKSPLHPQITIEQEEQPGHAPRGCRHLPMFHSIALRFTRGYRVRQSSGLPQRSQQALAGNGVHRS